VVVHSSTYALAADGSDTATITATVLDPGGVPVAGDDVTSRLATAGDAPGSCGSLGPGAGAVSLTDADGVVSLAYQASTDDVVCALRVTEGATGQSDQVLIGQGTAAEREPTITYVVPAPLVPGAPTQFTITVANPSSAAIRDPQVRLAITGKSRNARGVHASQVHLAIADGATKGTFRRLDLTGSTTRNGEIAGTIELGVGSLAAGASRSILVEISVDPAAVTFAATGRSLQFQIDLVQVNRADGSTTTLASAFDTARVVAARTIAGSHDGDVVVTSGSAVVVGAQVSGSVVVKPGASVEIEDSTITGRVDARGATGFQLCGSHVGGSVTVTSARGFVLAGDAGDDGCPPNTIGGALNIHDDTHGVDAIANTVSGPVSTIGNSGRGPLPVDTRPEITGNHP
jgi:hypothetical protein